MYKKIAVAMVMLLISGCSVLNFSQQAKKAVFQEETEWSIFYAWENSSDQERVLVIGDSIANGYVYNLKNIDKERAYSLFATSKSVCDPAYLRELKNVLVHNKYAMITFNNGIHGKKYSLEEYKDSFNKVIKKMEKIAGPVKIAIILSTPESKKVSEQIIERNKVCVEIAEKNGFPVIDLYNLVKGHEDWYNKDNVHFNNNGKKAQAEFIKKVIDCEAQKQ